MTALLQSATSYELHQKLCTILNIQPMHPISFHANKTRFRIHHVMYWHCRNQGIPNIEAELIVAEKMKDLIA